MGFTAAIICVLALVALTGGGALSGPPGPTVKKGFETASLGGAPGIYKPGEVIVKFKSGVGVRREREIRSSAGVSGTARDLAPKRAGGKVQLLRLKPGAHVEDAVNRLKGHPEVVYAEPNYRIRALYTPTDPGYPNQWGLNNTGQTIQGTPGTPGADIDAAGAWDIEKGNSNPVTVAVIDTGADLNHPDLAAKVTTGYNWAGISQLSDSFWNGSGWSYSAAYFGSTANNQSFAQSITGTGQNLTNVGIELMKSGNPLIGITVMVKQNLGDADPGLASFTINAAEVGTSLPPTEVYKALLPAAVPLASGTTYYLVFKTAGFSDPNYYYLFYNDPSTGGTYDWYREGDMWIYSGGTWSNLNPNDAYLRTNANAVPHDDDGHGTHTSGIAAAVEGNAQGGVGVSFGASIMPLKVLDSSGSGFVSDTVAAIYHAADNGARVINMSLGGYSFVQAEQDACSYAYNKGAALFASAGNDGDSTMNYPAGYSNVVGVGSTTNRDARSSFSNYNSSVDVTAPGQGIYSTMPTYAVGMTSMGYPQNYSNMSGTSMSAPMAAGVGALVRSKFPTMTPPQVEQQIENNADDLGSPGRDNYFGYGRVNAYRALVPPGISSISPTSGTAGTRVTINGTNLGSTQGSSYVTFNGVRSTDISSWSSSAIEARVPAGATTGPVKVTTGTGTSNGVTFTVTPMTFYFAEGTCRPNFDTYICIQNPGSINTNAKVIYMKGDGKTVEDQVPVPKNSRVTVSVKDKLGVGDDKAHDFSVRVQATNTAQIICERPMYFNYNGTWTGGHDVVGALTPAKTFYFAEGTCRPNFDSYICIQNPNSTDASVKITYMKGDGRTVEDTVPAPGNSRVTVSVKDKLGVGDDAAHDFSAKVESVSGPQIICERPMYFNYQGYTALNWTGGHDVVGALAPAKTFYFAEGSCRPNFDSYICIQNPNASDASVKITYMKGDGKNIEDNLTVRGNSRHTVVVKDRLGAGNDKAHDFSAKVQAMGGSRIICERPMYFNYNGAWTGGHDVVGALSPAKTFYFAEGTCRPNFDSYICIQNPGSSEAKVKITYIPGNGKSKEQTLTVPKNSRYTVVVRDRLGVGDDKAHDFSAKVETTNSARIICERPMYFNYNGAWTGGHDVVGFTQ